ncbi:hypothetical protein ABHV50_000697 [Vibrio vulnificus]|nr:hypothetical protein [Vibrio vulnificus]HDU8731445.1 hypothetical protein [Vibrio vulnificus]HDU8764713.1 hypothetical protein [Vibrio vulnificus]
MKKLSLAMSVYSKGVATTAVALCLWHGVANATFSIIGYDISDSGELGNNNIGVAVASCINFEGIGSPRDYNIAPYLSRIVPGKGAVITIANPGFRLTPDYKIESNPNLDNAIQRLKGGDSAPQIIRWLEDNDYWKNGGAPWNGTLQDRQYLVLGNKSSNGKYAASFSGENIGSSFGSLIGIHDRDNSMYKRGYIIAGNILHHGTLGALEEGFYNGRNSNGILKNLLASMLNVSEKNKQSGQAGDSRCTPATSSAFAYVTVQASSDKVFHRYYNLGLTDTTTDPVEKLIDSLLISNFDGWPDNRIPTASFYMEPEGVSYIFWEAMGSREQMYGVLDWRAQKFISTENKTKDFAPADSIGRVSAAVRNAYNPDYVNVFWDDNTYSDFNVKTKVFGKKYNARELRERWDGWPSNRGIVAATSIISQKAMFFVWDDQTISSVTFSAGGDGKVGPRVSLEEMFPGYPTGKRLTDIISIADSEGIIDGSGVDAALIAISFHDGSVAIYSLHDGFINRTTLLSSSPSIE